MFVRFFERKYLEKKERVVKQLCITNMHLSSKYKNEENIIKQTNHSSLHSNSN